VSIPNAAALEIPGLSKTDVRTLEKICTDGLTDCAPRPAPLFSTSSANFRFWL
jgi:hypothetical protein